MAKKPMAAVKQNGKSLEISGTAEEIMNVLDGAIHRQQTNAQTELSDNGHTIAITGATLNGNFLKYKYDLTIGDTTDGIKRDGGAIVHPDLKLAYAKMGIHLAVICELIDKDDIKDIDFIPLYKPETDAFDVLPADVRLLSEKASHFTVHAFFIDGNGEKEGVTLIGNMRLSTGDFVELKAPPVKWTSSSYKFLQELVVLTDELKDEVQKYMNGKSAPHLVQQEMNFEDDGNEGDEKPEEEVS